MREPATRSYMPTSHSYLNPKPLLDRPEYQRSIPIKSFFMNELPSQY